MLSLTDQHGEDEEEIIIFSWQSIIDEVLKPQIYFACSLSFTDLFNNLKTHTSRTDNSKRCISCPTLIEMTILSENNFLFAK